MMYTHVFAAGTFDRLHRGHEALLARAFAVADRVTVGITSDEFVKYFKNQNSKIKILPYEIRKNNILHWITENGYEKRVNIISIDDPYEPAVSMEDLDAIMVTADNKFRGIEINKKRASKKLKEVAFVEVLIVPSQDAAPISSTRVRNGEIDASGRLIMPDALRPELAKPLGVVLTGDGIGSSIEKNRSGIIITVGDMTAKTMLTAGVVPNFIIVDLRVGRKPFPEIEEKLKDLGLFRMEIESGPGFISQDAVATIQKWSKNPAEKMILAISGEEDLLTLPSVAYGPEGAVVYYGQPARHRYAQALAGGPGEGLVEIVVTQEKKQEAAALLAKFIQL